MSDNDTAQKQRVRTCHERWMRGEHHHGLVSVIIPTCNRAHLLTESMNSVWEQSYRPIELVVVDDGSVDNTRHVVEQWNRAHGNDGHFKLHYIHQDNRGAPAARNLGLIESHGEFIQFLDSDDLLHRDKLTLQVDRLVSDRSLGFVYSATAAFTDAPDWSATPFSGVPVRKEQLLSAFILCPVWITSSGVYSRNTCVVLGPWDETCSRCQDWEYNIRLILSDPCIAFVDRTLSSHRFHTEGRISDPFSSECAVRRVFSTRKKVAQRIRTAGQLEGEVEWAMASCYFGLVKAALRLGYVHLAREIADCVSRLHVNPVQERQMMFWRSLAYLPAWCGPRLASTVLYLSAAKRRVCVKKTGLISECDAASIGHR